MRHALIPLAMAGALTLLACDDDPKVDAEPTDVPSDTAPADGTGDATTASDSDVVTVSDTDPADDVPDTDATEPSDLLDGADGTVKAAYIENCESLYAVRIVELQVALDGSFPIDCDEPLRSDIGQLSETGMPPQCAAGESANACQQRNYETPPPISAFGSTCTPSDDGCFIAKWVPKCTDGTDTGCSEPEAICVDGTRPAVHIEGATTGASNAWIIHMGGEGGPCNGDKCWLDYRFFGNDEFPKAMSSHHPDYPMRASKTLGGIMNGNAAPGNPFAAFNRVRMQRCGDAASSAVEMVAVGDGVDPASVADFLDELPPGVPVQTRVSQAPVYHRGHATYSALFNALTTDSGRDLDGDGAPDLPDLANATQVVLTGSSDASIWLAFAADALAEELRAIAGTDVDVRIMIDGHFDVALDAQGRFHPAAPAGFDALRDTYYTTGLCTLPDNSDGIDNEACSDAQYATGGQRRQGHDLRNITRDASCEAFHGAGHPACNDKAHTLVHHVSTPVLVLADQEDRTLAGAPPAFADDISYRWPLADYRLGVLSFGLDIQSSWPTDAREEGAGTDGDFALILHKFRRESGTGTATHVRFGSTSDMSDGMTRCAADGTPLANPSFSTLIGAWLADMSPSPFALEAGPAWDGTSDYWVTDPTCPAPE